MKRILFALAAGVLIGCSGGAVQKTPPADTTVVDTAKVKPDTGKAHDSTHARPDTAKVKHPRKH